MGCCEWCSTYFRAPFIWLLSLVQITFCIAIINIIYWHLTNYDTSINIAEKPQLVSYQCLLGTDHDGNDLCTYGYIVSGVTLGGTLILMISVCLRCKCWAYFDIWVEWVLAIAGTLWWLVAAVIFTNYNQKLTDDFNNRGLPDVRKDWRDTVTTLSWLMTLIFFIQYLLYQFRLCYKVCGCCGGKAEAERIKLEKEKAKQDEAAAAAAAASAAATKPPQDIEAARPVSPSQPYAEPSAPAAVVVSSPDGVPPAAPAPAPAKSSSWFSWGKTAAPTDVNPEVK